MGEKARGVSTTTIGFDDSFDERLLATMAASGRGNSYYVGSPEGAPAVFGQEFEDFASLMAQNVSVEIRKRDLDAPNTCVWGTRCGHRGASSRRSGGDTYGDEHRRILCQLHILEVAGLGVAKVADVILRYVSVSDTIEAHEVTIPVTVNIVTADEASKAALISKSSKRC